MITEDILFRANRKDDNNWIEHFTNCYRFLN